MPVSTAKAVARTSLVGGGGIIGTTVPAVQLSKANEKNRGLIEENEKLKKITQNIANTPSKETKCYWLSSRRIMQYLWKYHYDTIKNGNDKVKPFSQQLTSAFYTAKDKFKNLENMPDNCDPNLKAFVKALPENINDVVVG